MLKNNTTMNSVSNIVTSNCVFSHYLLYQICGKNGRGFAHFQTNNYLSIRSAIRPLRITFPFVLPPNHFEKFHARAFIVQCPLLWFRGSCKNNVNASNWHLQFDQRATVPSVLFGYFAMWDSQRASGCGRVWCGCGVGCMDRLVWALMCLVRHGSGVGVLV